MPHPLMWANPNISDDIRIRATANLLRPKPPRMHAGHPFLPAARATIAIGMPMGTSLEMTSSHTAASANSSRAAGVLPVSMPSGISIDFPNIMLTTMIMMLTAIIAANMYPIPNRGVFSIFSSALPSSDILFHV